MDNLVAKRIDRLDLLESPAFWAIHFDLQVRGGGPLERFFGLSEEAIGDFWRVNFGDSVPGEPLRYPCYRLMLPLPGGGSTSVEYRQYPEDGGIDFYIQDPSWPEPLLLGSQDGHFRLPGFMWEEIVHIAHALERTPSHHALNRAAIPLLLPAVWLSDDEDLAPIRTRLHSAWGGLGIVDPAYLDDLVGLLIEASRVPYRWRQDERFGWISDSPYSIRNPKSKADPDYFGRIAVFFKGL